MTVLLKVVTGLVLSLKVARAFKMFSIVLLSFLKNWKKSISGRQSLWFRTKACSQRCGLDLIIMIMAFLGQESLVWQSRASLFQKICPITRKTKLIFIDHMLMISF